ncbi:bifunctional diguanylate cyclase/phosphodiesterase [Chelatococcus reniformis]|uniref:Bifunctional diguanylate cyclase/phosphodiesterase n=1 Tax=Chelatococcus reniformis TaxID=1494448 RepID=A0A916UVM5_9HYPH|nr:bifunctional diguanylate cyclase/phosphodiesterase [Chelatococcus reniformis]
MHFEALEVMPKILIVDDSPTNRRIYSELARQLQVDVRVRTFETGLKALDWLAENTADLIITDYKMPNMTGATLIGAVRALPQHRDLPIIVITAYDDRGYRVSSLEAGATDFLLSPVDHVEFLARARNLLKLRAQHLLIAQRADQLEMNLNATDLLLRESRDALAQVIDTVPALISAVDLEGRCVLVNAHQAAFVGKAPAELVGHSVEALFGDERGDISRRLDRLVLRTGAPSPPREEDVVTPGGEHRVYLTSKAPLHDGTGRITSILNTSIDITERRQAERRLEYLANHDSLTGLPNRMMLRDHLRRELVRGRRGQNFALHFMDLDRFKAVNDADGHQSGDRLLQDVAERLIRLIPSGYTVARLGGDEFAVLQPDIDGPEDAGRLAQAILDMLAAEDDEGEAVKIAASIGVTIAPPDGADPDELLRNSDQAMYLAKSLGGGTWRFFSPDMARRASEQAQLEAELRSAVKRQEFELHYQPFVDLRDNSVVGAEALLRWRHPQRGMLRPDAFLGLAEESGLILPINEWVLREACRQGAVWNAAGHGALRIAVNVSPIQFRRQKVGDLVREALAESGLRPDLLELELTEGILISHDDQILGEMALLRSLGVSLSVDDFSTGYSSLSYIRNFPLQRLKIDSSFVKELAHGPRALAIVRTIIDLGHILNLQVLAEGVEEEEQLAVLRAEGCDEVQGYYFSRPLPPAAFIEWLSAQGMEGAHARPSKAERTHAGRV